MAEKKLRVVSEEERREQPMTLLEAVEDGDVLAILKAQRRIIAESLATASENTKPQYSNELTKLTKLITEEEGRRAVERGENSVVARTDDETWDSSAI
jgi:hypothetical protein